ncbi:MAG: T9SS type A sorting domain-containing protein [Bacteroidota bacterium]
MKKLLFLSLSLMLSICAIAQTNWTTVNSGLLAGQGVGQLSIGMADNTGLWAHAVDATGLIVDRWTRSMDGGQTWSSGTFNAGTGLSQLFAIDGGTCWAVFNTGATQGLYKTQDGGTTWVKKGGVFNASSFADVIHFFNDNEGFAMGDPVGGYFEIYTTTDGGETWTRVPQANISAPTTGEYGITGNYSAVGNNAWFGTNLGRIFRSVDKGLHWTAVLTPFGNAQVVQPEFADALHGICYRSYLDLGLELIIDVTSDGGVTWTEVNVTGDMYARYFSYIPGTANTYVGSSSAVGANGISVSYDGGYTWNVLNAGYDFNATAWIDNATGWAGSIAAAKKSTESTGGMYIYNGEPLAPTLPVANFQADNVAVALNGSVHFTDLSTGTPTSWAWTFAGGTPATSTLKTPPAIVYNTSGSFNVSLTVTNPNGTNSVTKTNYIYVGGVGMNDISAPAVSVFPNPASDQINIICGDQIQKITLLDISGKEVYSGVEKNINISKLQTGIYFIRTVTGKGVSTIRFIKE